jgi:Rrf2 family cysteine metabolism transcriptional repressor
VKLSPRCRYALRAIFELAKRESDAGPTPIGLIAQTQSIPPRYLELILAQAKLAGFVQSKRGRAGGYALARNPRDISVGDVIRAFDGPIVVGEADANACPPDVAYAFSEIWQEASEALTRALEGASFADLVQAEAARTATVSRMFCI